MQGESTKKIKPRMSSDFRIYLRDRDILAGGYAFKYLVESLPYKGEEIFRWAVTTEGIVIESQLLK